MQKYAFEKGWKDHKTSTHKRLHDVLSTPCKNFLNFGSVTPEILSLQKVALSNPSLPQTTPFSIICVAFHIFVVGGDREFKLVGRLIIASDSPQVTNCP